MSDVLLRKQFRESVFDRDANICIVPWCNESAQDAHHIIGKPLWKANDTYPGGYVLDNGVSLCTNHHIAAENNYFPPQACRIWAGIERRILPKQFDPDFWYTKWGKALKHPTRIECKYPSTPYLNFSPGGDHDFVLPLKFLLNKPLVVTIKMDGANTVIRSNSKVAGRNGDNAIHRQYNLLKASAYSLSQSIPKGVQVFGEWLYAKHSIHYEDLEAYFQPFAAYHYRNQMWLSLDDVGVLAEKMQVPTVPVLGHVQCDNEHEFVSIISSLAEETIKRGHEGVVVRSRYPFHYAQFVQNTAKYVRIGHVQNKEKHWSKRPIIQNLLRK